MKHFFLDTNVVIDLLSDRKPFSLHVGKLFTHAEKNKVKLYVSALSYNNIYYVLKKTTSHKELMLLLRNIENRTVTLNVTNDVIHHSLHSMFTDFEDGIQYFTALSSHKTDAIVTRNVNDYKHSELPVLTPEEALSLMESFD